MLTDAELAAMRAAQNETLPDVCIRERPVLIANGAGGHTEGEPKTQQYMCRVAATGGRDLEVAARLTTERTLTVTLPYDADVVSSDRLRVGDRQLQVIAPLAGGTWMTALRVLAVEAT